MTYTTTTTIIEILPTIIITKNNFIILLLLSSFIIIYWILLCDGRRVYCPVAEMLASGMKSTAVLDPNFQRRTATIL